MYKFTETFTPNQSRVYEIDWHHYREGLKKASEENKLMLLVISASWCYWCHVLDETTLSDEKILKRIKDELVAVRVDADREPDLEARYSQEGLPSVLILSPHGITLAGGNFFTSTELDMLIVEASNFMQTQRKNYFDHKDELERTIEKFRKEKTVVTGEADYEKIIREVILQAVVSMDNEVPGFSVEPKMPHPQMLNFMLGYSEIEGEEELLELPERILTAMLEGGLFDNEEGGFFRYARARDWSDPQTDKHLYDNALLIETYSKAYKLTKNEAFKEAVTKTIDYLDSRLKNPPGLYGIAQDANDLYYSLDSEERRNVEVSPRIDLTPIAAYNSRLAASLAECSVNLSEPVFLEKAQQIIDGLIENFLTDSNIYLPLRGEDIEGRFLQDAAEMINAFITISRLASDEVLLEHASSIYSAVKENLYDENKLLFSDRMHQEGEEGALRLRYSPFNENCTMASSIIELVKNGLIPEEELKVAESILQLLSEDVQDLGPFSAPLGIAAMKLKKLKLEN